MRANPSLEWTATGKPLGPPAGLGHHPSSGPSAFPASAPSAQTLGLAFSNVDGFTELLRIATSQIEHAFFHIELDGGMPVYRERVYCYELYHQLRLQWPASSPFRLNGELDKSAHPILKFMGADYAKPDLLVHTPGHMGGNDTIIEVKSSTASRKGIKKDLNTLGLFRTAVGYQRAIYLVYGYEAEQTIARVRAVAHKIGGLPPIELWVHAVPGEPASEVQLID